MSKMEIKWDGRMKLILFYILFYFVNAVTISLENDTFRRWMTSEEASVMLWEGWGRGLYYLLSAAGYSQRWGRDG